MGRHTFWKWSGTKGLGLYGGDAGTAEVHDLKAEVKSWSYTNRD